VRTNGHSLRRGRGAALAAGAVAALPAHASMFAGEALDKAADILTIVVLVVVPIVAIAVFWIVHVLPEKIAHKRHHPQRDAIQTLCLLSLVFGGLLWPLAWLWAYTRPIGYRMAYGTEKHDDYFHEMGEKFHAGKLSDAEISHLRDELDAMDEAGALPPAFRKLRQEIDALPAGATAPARPATAPATAPAAPAKDRA
jgi:CBS domain containing-hemolysin-like protein